MELIADPIDKGGEARAVQSPRGSAFLMRLIKAITRLQQSALVTGQPYGATFLTDQGRGIAEQSRQRQEIVVTFLYPSG